MKMLGNDREQVMQGLVRLVKKLAINRQWEPTERF